MVAAGATVLMAASEENSSNETEGSATCSRYSEMQHCGDRNVESSIKGDVATCSSNIKKKQRSLALEKNSKIVSKAEPKESFKNFPACKTTQIRETRTSRLRAASIILPSADATLPSKRLFGSEAPISHKHNLSAKEEGSMSLDGGIAMNSCKERDKSKRKSYLNRSRHPEATSVDGLSETESGQRRSRRQSIKRNHVNETMSHPVDSCINRQTANPRRKYIDTKASSGQCNTMKNSSKLSSSSSVVCVANAKCMNAQQSVGSVCDSEVSRRVDVLTALTRATMERVERLSSSTANCANHTVEGAAPEKVSFSPRRCTISRHGPISILKHKAIDGERCDRQASSAGSSHAPSPVTFSPSVAEGLSHKRHGILKKRSSLDESEILRRRSCSPDVTFAENSYSEFKPILKNQRRSSLDEIVKRDQSPDQQPASILKRRSSREDDREVHRSLLGTLEPQGILKRKLANHIRTSGANHHVTISSDVLSANVSDGAGTPCLCAGANTSGLAESFIEGSEVKPILKKKHVKEESAGGDVTAHEPRPILKKKSSTESEDHEHDRPKKTILKCTRKNSEEGGYDTELASPRKSSALKNRAAEVESVRPILKQSAGVRQHDDVHDAGADLFLRKRAQSVGHAQVVDENDHVSESIRVLAKRRSLESSSPSDVLRVPTSARRSFTTERSNVVSHVANSAVKDGKLLGEGSIKAKQSNATNAEGKSKMDPHIHFAKVNSDAEEERPMDEKKVLEEKKRQDVQRQRDDYAAVRRSSSLSKVAQCFKELQEKQSGATAAAESACQRARKSSHGVQRYRERKVQSNERFNTQPVTFEEVREAVLQNQRNAALNAAGTADDEPDPCKLSLAERVRLFNQRIAIIDAGTKERHTQRRRPSTRYKTQPVTSAEMEVASRVSSLNADYQTAGHTRELQRALHSPPPPAAVSQHDLPKSILKFSAGYTANLSRAKCTELRGMKLIKSVLKREYEETDQLVALSSSEIFPRSILKGNPHPRAVQDTAVTLSGDNGMPSLNSETARLHETLSSAVEVNDIARHSAQRSNQDARLPTPDESDVVENETSVPFREAAAASQHDGIQLDHLDDRGRNASIMNRALRRRKGESRDDFIVAVRRSDDEQDRNNDDNDNYDDNNDDNDRDADEEAEEEDVELDEDDDRASSSSGGYEIRNIIVDKHPAGVACYAVNSLAKSVSQHSLGGSQGRQQRGIPLPGLCRSATQVITSIETSETPGVSIADRLVALRHSGSTNWRRRVASGGDSCDPALVPSDDNAAVKSGVLADCIGKLESATENWKSRIIAPDAVNFTVAGKLKVAKTKDTGSSFVTEATANVLSQRKKVSRPRWIKARKDRGYTNGAASTPSSPCKDLSAATRMSYSEPVSDDSGEEYKTEHVLSPTVSVPKPDDETFTSFFSGVSLEKCEIECLDLDETDFDIITPQSELLVQKRNIRTQRRRATSRNPLKALAARTDLRSEYTEIRMDIAARTMKSLTVEKPTKSSTLAVEALAGLASTEDFSAVTLRNVAETSTTVNKLQPYKDLMLILIKGRRHVQARLVEPVYESINSGDNYILVTKSEVFHYVGKYSNVIEKTRAAEIASSVQQRKDLGCQASQVITINEDKSTCTKSQIQKFWRHLGVFDAEKIDVIEAGHPDEDELYESAIIDTNAVYELKDKQLVPHERLWGMLPKIEMLDKNKILVFDFGTEMYIWNGKNITTDKKKLATELATEIWNEGYDYNECTICPINAARVIGGRNDDTHAKLLAKSARSRPDWCLFAKLTQHVETILFREKFLDWPNAAGVIRTRNTENDVLQCDGAVTVYLDDSDDMWKPNVTPVNLALEGCHLGRGTGCYDNELKKEYVVVTTNVMVWHIDEFAHTLLDESSFGQFYSGDSYIVQWTYTVTITGRDLSGLPSKHSAKGRDRSVYFIWQGRNASLNERGAAALLTVELDSDRGPQIRVVQGHEPAAFLNLFSGKMVVHSGKKIDKRLEKQWRLYICRGTLDSETFLVEIPCSTRQLRNRGSFVLLDTENAKAYVWHGNNSLRHIRENTVRAANRLKESRPAEAGLSYETDVQVYEIYEGSEPEEFSNGLSGVNKKLYWSPEITQISEHTPRLYHLFNVSNKIGVTEILCSHRAHLATPFPFLQDDLYQVSQPALFLLDDKNVIWIWQGWWPDSGTEVQSGSKTVRWQAERKAAMTIAIRYWQNTRNEPTTNLPIYLIWAGLEPLQFINLFPEWTYRDDIAEMNIEVGRNLGDVLMAENELARLTKSTYPPAQLLQRPLPDGVDPTRLELYLSQQHFQELLGMSKEEFQQLPVWKQVNLKKDIGLF